MDSPRSVTPGGRPPYPPLRCAPTRWFLPVVPATRRAQYRPLAGLKARLAGPVRPSRRSPRFGPSNLTNHKSPNNLGQLRACVFLEEMAGAFDHGVLPAGRAGNGALQHRGHRAGDRVAFAERNQDRPGIAPELLP